MREDLVAAALLVQAGLTYGEAGKELGLRRNQVAGACNRLKVRAPLTPEKAGRGHKAAGASRKAYWASLSAAEKTAWSRRMHRIYVESRRRAPA